MEFDKEEDKQGKKMVDAEEMDRIQLVGLVSTAGFEGVFGGDRKGRR